jgi:F-type H+-transporting ATPase subunit delta
LDSIGLRRRLRDAVGLWGNEKNGRHVEGTQSIIPGMAGRYASALFELALELARLVMSPVFGADDKLRALSAILDKAGITGMAANFLRVLTTNRRLSAAREVIRAYRALVARHRGEVTAQVTAAEKLSDKNLEALKDALKSKTAGKEIDLEVKIDPAIIGGLIVKVGSRMVDSSLRTKLNSIKLAMKEAR